MRCRYSPPPLRLQTPSRRASFLRAQAACIVDDDGAGAYWVYSLALCAVIVFALGGLWLLKLGCAAKGRTLAADRVEYVLSIIFTLQLTMGWRTAFRVFLSPSVSRALSSATAASALALGTAQLLAIAFALTLLIAHVLMIVHFTRKLQAFRAGTQHGVWLQRPLFSRRARTIAPRRLNQQLRYLTLRFAPHAPSWQLVIWLRQGCLVAIQLMMDVALPRVEAAATGYVRYFPAGAVAVCLCLFLVWHCRKQVRIALSLRLSLVLMRSCPDALLS